MRCALLTCHLYVYVFPDSMYGIFYPKYLLNTPHTPLSLQSIVWVPKQLGPVPFLNLDTDLNYVFSLHNCSFYSLSLATATFIIDYIT